MNVIYGLIVGSGLSLCICAALTAFDRSRHAKWHEYQEVINAWDSYPTLRDYIRHDLYDDNIVTRGEVYALRKLVQHQKMMDARRQMYDRLMGK